MPEQEREECPNPIRFGGCKCKPACIYCGMGEHASVHRIVRLGNWGGEQGHDFMPRPKVGGSDENA